MSFSLWAEPSVTKVSNDEENLFFLHEMSTSTSAFTVAWHGTWKSLMSDIWKGSMNLATYQFLFFLFLAIPVYLLTTGLCYYSVSHKINGIKPHNKMTLETSVPTSHKTGFIFTSQFNNMKIPQKKNLPVLQKLSPKMIPTALS